MKRGTDPARETAIDAAIAHVLASERAAKGSIADAECAALALLDAARGEARAIAERAERRIRVARERFEARIGEDVAALQRAAEALERSHTLTAVEQAEVDRAVAALAAELTGGTV